MNPWTLDFETEPIDFARPHRAPKPVGLAVRQPDGRAGYYAWGHPEGNGCWEISRRGKLRRVSAALSKQAKTAWEHALFDSGRPLLFHNASFDLSVAAEHWGFAWPEDDRIEDTRPLAFLADPYRRKLGLKALADDLLDMPPQEETELFTWIAAHVPEAKGKRKGLGAWIGRAPGGLVAPYAIGDVERTFRLWRHTAPVRKAFRRAYRELEIPMLGVAHRMTQRGFPVNASALERFVEETPGELRRLEAGLRRALQAPGLDFQDADAVADRLEARGWVAPDAWRLTDKTNFRSLAHEDLARVVAPGGRRWAETWALRGSLRFQLSHIALPWLERMERGRVHVVWNTTPFEAGPGRRYGAKTGRLSSSPNVQNVAREAAVRAWVRAPRGRRLVGADLSQQEPRILAHFAGGKMLEELHADPRTDAHSAVAALLGVERGVGKTLNLAITYALGLGALAERLGVDSTAASAHRRAFYRARPEVGELDAALKQGWAQGKALRTWAGVEVRVEPTPQEPGRFAYRALNYLIQRSAAEQLKAAMVTADGADLALVLSVHDELVVESAERRAERRAKVLAFALEQTNWLSPWRVPFVADVGVGSTWASVKK